jgi:hypothetical protein
LGAGLETNPAASHCSRLAALVAEIVGA